MTLGSPAPFFAIFNYSPSDVAWCFFFQPCVEGLRGLEEGRSGCRISCRKCHRFESFGLAFSVGAGQIERGIEGPGSSALVRRPGRRQELLVDEAIGAAMASCRVSRPD